jgi:phosphoglycolate phosphatase
LPDLEDAGKPKAFWRGNRIDAVLFDLDGTLLDTIADIAIALNLAVAEFGWQPVAESDVRQMIGQGGPMLLQRTAALQGRPLSAAARAAMVERYFHHYGALEEHNTFSAKPYDGARECLQALREARLQVAVVTNKQIIFAEGLLARLNLIALVDLVVGGDSCARRKPDPEPLIHACKTLGVLPAQSLMVGDSINDVEAARGAGIPVICVPYGYNQGNDPRTLPCDALIESLAELPSWLDLKSLA